MALLGAGRGVLAGASRGRPAPVMVLNRRLGVGLLGAGLLGVGLLGGPLLGLAGCAGSQFSNPPPGAGVGTQVELTRTLRVPPQRAHAVFQGGRQVSGRGYSSPYCELEVARVSEQAQSVPPARLSVRSARFTLLKDPVTRIPAWISGFSCSDDLFQESIWYLDSASDSPVRFLRCVVPYFNCRIGPPMSLEQVPTVVGPTIRIGTPPTGPVEGAGSGSAGGPG